MPYVLSIFVKLLVAGWVLTFARALSKTNSGAAEANRRLSWEATKPNNNMFDSDRPNILSHPPSNWGKSSSLDKPEMAIRC